MATWESQLRKLILRNSDSPGDILMLTAAVRDLHTCYPESFQTDVRTPYPELWDNNPNLTLLEEADPEVEIIDCSCPLVLRSNLAPYHFIHGFIDFLNVRLGLQIQPTFFKADIHLSYRERTSFPTEIGFDPGIQPFWIVVAGGKYDFTTKWWDVRRYQEVVKHFRGKIQFVQVGAEQDYHPPLDDVIDLRGKTSLRQLINLVYHAQGVLCPVTLVMHLAAAVDVKDNRPRNRPCVVVAGGREPPHWEAYPQHQFIHTVGALPCCERGGCWRARTVALGDGTKMDEPRNLCVDVVGHLPRCMDMISADEVIRRIELYFAGGVLGDLPAPMTSPSATNHS